mmetsp:Transcript_93499/g.150964  ORF Transcript_93499/g.150964 Transcript_93499/m.150964 type:complete len:237 (-) Transcript_93499:276-986(-)
MLLMRHNTICRACSSPAASCLISRSSRSTSLLSICCAATLSSKLSSTSCIWHTCASASSRVICPPSSSSSSPPAVAAELSAAAAAAICSSRRGEKASISGGHGEDARGLRCWNSNFLLRCWYDCSTGEMYEKHNSSPEATAQTVIMQVPGRLFGRGCESTLGLHEWLNIAPATKIPPMKELKAIFRTSPSISSSLSWRTPSLAASFCSCTSLPTDRSYSTRARASTAGSTSSRERG